MLNKKFIRPIIELALEEDIGKEDITTSAIFDDSLKGTGYFLCKEDGMLAGIEIIEYLIRNYTRLRFSNSKNDGEMIKSGETFAIVEGDVREILTYERIMLNFLQRMSGIATLTNQFVKRVEGTKAKILDTRKTIPGWRYLEKLAVKIGGGENHRFGLYDMFLIKDNHIEAAGGIKQAIEKCIEFRNRLHPKYQIEVEVKNLEELQIALNYDIERILLDNFEMNEIREAVKLTNGRVALEVSGGVNLNNIEEIAKTGVDYISVGALTHSAKALDISLEVSLI